MSFFIHALTRGCIRPGSAALLACGGMGATASVIMTRPDNHPKPEWGRGGTPPPPLSIKVGVTLPPCAGPAEGIPSPFYPKTTDTIL
jgi:hypothetical protein